MKQLFFTTILGGAILFLSVGCTSSRSKVRSVNIDEFYSGTGVVTYFLPDIPDWANFSQSAGCFRTRRLRYFDITALMKSFSLKYADAIQLQASFNSDYLSMTKKDGASLSFKDEEVLFFKSSDKVSNKIYFFTPPTFKQVHLIWLDEVLKDKKQKEKLKQFLQSSLHDDGVPVLVSACLTKEEIEMEFPDHGMKIISAELFSIYGEDGVKKPTLHVNIGSLFNPQQKLIFYSQEAKKLPEDIQGTIKMSNY